jgi:hypothetical protein
MSHQVFHDAQSFEAWIQRDSHHVVNFPHIKRFQKIQKRFLLPLPPLDTYYCAQGGSQLQ